MLFAKGTIGFSRKRGLWAKIVRWLTRSEWSCAFVICQVSPDITAVEASRGKVSAVPITKYESSKYVTTFFFPQGILDERISIGVARAQLVERSVVTEASGSNLILEYLRGVEPRSRWDFMKGYQVTLESLFEELALHSSFRQVNST
jgi:hypothetical protein